MMKKYNCGKRRQITDMNVSRAHFSHLSKRLPSVTADSLPDLHPWPVYCSLSRHTCPSVPGHVWTKGRATSQVHFISCSASSSPDVHLENFSTDTGGGLMADKLPRGQVMKCNLCIILIESSGWKSNDNVHHAWRVSGQQRKRFVSGVSAQLGLWQNGFLFSSRWPFLHFNCGLHGAMSRPVMTWRLVNDAEDVQAIMRHIYNAIQQIPY